MKRSSARLAWLCGLMLLPGIAAAAVPGALYGTLLGPGRDVMTLGENQGATTYAMPTLNNGYCARHAADSTKDIKSIRVHWTTVTTPGTVAFRYETMTGTTGKPSGTLYDASAAKTVTPTAGIQTVTFDALPTAGRTIGTEYCVLLLTASTGTAHTLTGRVASESFYPSMVLTAADGSTRTNFAEVGDTLPIVSLVLEDDTEVAAGMTPYHGEVARNIFGATQEGLTFTVPAKTTLTAAGIWWECATTGTPAGDLVVQIRQRASPYTAVSGTARTIDKDSLITCSGRQGAALFGTNVVLTAGNYFVDFACASCANSSNAWKLIGMVPLSTVLTPTAFVRANSTDSGVNWTFASNGEVVPVGVLVDSLVGVGGGGIISSAMIPDGQAWPMLAMGLAAGLWWYWQRQRR